MYLRTFKQYLRTLQPSFDERQFGFSSTYELVRQAHRDGLLRVDRNRQGILRIYPADRFPRMTPGQPAEESSPAEAVETELEISAQEAPIPTQEPQPVLQAELPDGFAEIRTEIAEQPPEPGTEDAAVETGPIEILEEAVEETAHKRKPTRTRKPSASKTTRSPRRRKSKAASN